MIHKAKLIMEMSEVWAEFLKNERSFERSIKNEQKFAEILERSRNWSRTGAKQGPKLEPNRSQLKISFYKKASDTTMSDEPQAVSEFVSAQFSPFPCQTLNICLYY